MAKSESGVPGVLLCYAARASFVVINSFFFFFNFDQFDVFILCAVLFSSKLLTNVFRGFVTFSIFNCSNHVEIQALYAKGSSWTRRPFCGCGKS